MKKVIRSAISLFIILSLIVSVGSISFAEEPTMNEIFKEKSVLTRLGIIKDTFGGEEEVTRAEFAAILCRALKLGKVDKTYFQDVPRTHYACGEISALVEMNIISLSAEGKFNPEDNITYEQVCKMLVYATGYQSIAKFSDLGMKAYPMVASNVGFAITPKSQQSITKTEAVKLLFKAMTVNVARTPYLENKETTLFSRYYDVYYDKGQLRGICGWTLDGYNLQNNKVSIDGEIMFKDDDLRLDSLFAEDIGYIYINDDEKTVIFAESLGDDSRVIESSSITSFDSGNFSINYEENNRTKKVSIKKDATICLNGAIYTKPLSVEIKKFIDGERKGTVRLINSKNSSGYDIVIIKSYETFILGAYDSANETYYDYCKNTNTFCIKDYENVLVLDKNGKETTIPNTYPAPILLLKREDKNYAEIIRFDEKTNITITSIYGDERKIGTDKGEYKIDGSNYEYIRNQFSVGNTYSVFVDVYDEIIFALRSIEDNKMIGYIRKVVYKRRDEESPLTFTIYCDDGVTRNYKLARKVKIDGKRYKSDECRDIILAFPGSNSFDIEARTVDLQKQPILFEMNEEQEITLIDTYNISTEETGIKEKTLRQIDAGKYRYIAGNSSKIGSKMAVNKDTKYIVVPTVSSDEETDNMYANKYALSDRELFNFVEGYKFNDNTLAMDLIIIKAVAKNTGKMPYMFKKMWRGLNADEEVCDYMACFLQGGEKSFELDETYSGPTLNKGDIFLVDMDATGEKIFSITKQFDANTLTFERNGSYTDSDRTYWYGNTPSPDSEGGFGDWLGDPHQLLKAYVYDIKGGVMAISYTLADAQKAFKDEKYVSERFNVSNLKVTIFDKLNPNDSPYQGSISDILTYKIAGNNCDLILIGNSGNQIGQIFVYKNYK